MKKLLIVVIVFLILACNFPAKKFSLLDYFNGEYTAYTQTAIDENSVDLGFCYMQNCTVKTKLLIGESVKVYNFEIGSALKELKAKVVKTEMITDIISIGISGLRYCISRRKSLPLFIQ